MSSSELFCPFCGEVAEERGKTRSLMAPPGWYRCPYCLNDTLGFKLPARKRVSSLIDVGGGGPDMFVNPYQRFYLPMHSGPPGVVWQAEVSPAYSAWDYVGTPAARTKLVTARLGTALGAAVFQDQFGVVNKRHLWKQFVSGPMHAQTIGGAGVTVRGVMRPARDGTFSYDHISMVLKVVSDDGSVLRGTLVPLGEYQPDGFFSADPAESRSIAEDAATTQVSAMRRDRLVLELGAKVNVVGVAPTIGQNIFGTFGDDSAYDLDYLGLDQTDPYNPWIQIYR